MSSTAGNLEWQRLAVRGPRGKHRSPQSLVFEAALKVMLARTNAPDLAGLWVDFLDARQGPVWLPTPAGAAKEAAAAAERELELKTAPFSPGLKLLTKP